MSVRLVDHCHTIVWDNVTAWIQSLFAWVDETTPESKIPYNQPQNYQSSSAKKQSSQLQARLDAAK
jgi:hypothetical protein